MGSIVKTCALKKKKKDKQKLLSGIDVQSCVVTFLVLWILKVRFLPEVYDIFNGSL